jgi:hypothetical protein
MVVVTLGVFFCGASLPEENPPATGNVGTMATGAPTAAPGPTYGPWTSPNPGQSASQCQPGEYAIGAGFNALTNSAAASDTVVVSQKSVTDKYIVLVIAVAACSFSISFATMGMTTTEQPVFSFTVIKGSAS